MMSPVTTFHQRLRPLVLLLVLVTLFFSNVPYALATGTLSLGVTAIDPDTNQPINPTNTSLQTGDLIEYVIDFSCSSVTGDCGGLNIDFTIDSELTFVEIIAPPGYSGTFTSPVVNIINDPTTNPVFDGGEAGQVTVRLRVNQDIDDQQLNVTAVGTITTGPSGGTEIVTVPGSSISIATPVGGWNTSKNKTLPTSTPNVEPGSGGSANYQIQACPVNPALGVARLETVTIVDRFPPGATPSNISNGGTASDVLDAAGLAPGDVGYAGPDGVDDTITWTITNTPPNYHTADDGCLGVTYTLTYPTGDFPVGTSIDNTYSYSSTTPDTPFPANGTCPNCVGTGTRGGTIANPAVTVATNKTGPGVAVIAPAPPSGNNQEGVTPFTINWNLNQANTATSGFTVTDVFPIAINETRPIMDVVQLNSGTWADNTITAEWEYLDGPIATGTWQSLGTLNGTAVTRNSPADFPVPIYGVRWRFTTDVPQGFAPTTDPIIWFTVPTGLDPAAYGSSGPPPVPQSYQNCATFVGTFTNAAGNPANATAPDACTNFLVGETATDGFTNIRTSKESAPNDVFPNQDIQFELEVELTQEASGALINPVIEDVLPFGMQITRIDSVTFPGTSAPNDTTPLPYLFVSTVNTGTNPLTGATNQPVQRLRFSWSSTAPGASPATGATGIFACGTLPCTIDDDISNFDLVAGNRTTAGTPANALTITAPGQGINKRIVINFTARARLDTPAGDNSGNSITYSNATTVVAGSANLICQAGTGANGTDGDDIDGDGNTGERTCATDDEYRIREAAQIAGKKWIRSVSGPFDFRNTNNLNNTSPSCPTFNYDTDNADGDGNTTTGAEQFTRFPCVARGQVGGALEYLLQINNTGLANVDEFILYDILPHENDLGVSQAISGEARESEFRTFLTGPLEVEASTGGGYTFEVEYFLGDPDPTNAYGDNMDANSEYNPYRPEMLTAFDNPPSAFPANDWSTGQNATWVNAAGVGGNWNQVTAIRIRQTSGVIPPGAQIVLTGPAIISALDDPLVGGRDESETGEISWNSFAHRYTNAFSDRRLLTAAPRKVGIIVEEKYSIGNRVWIDNGDGGGTPADGILNGTEAGVDGVTVQLYSRTRPNSTSPYGNFTLVTTDTTRNGGYYFFGNLDSDTNTEWLVHIPAANFAAGGALESHVNSYFNSGPGAERDDGAYIAGQGNARVDSRDNGDNDGTGFASVPAGGASTRNFQLLRDQQSTVDADALTDGATPDGDPPTNEGQWGRGENNEADDFSDLTRDFGFYRPFSIGSLVWLDNATGVGATPGDGIVNDTELAGGVPQTGIADVELEIYRDNGDGTFNAATDTLIREAEDNIVTAVGGTRYEVTTDANGYYIFDGLPEGNYFVRLVPGNFQFDTTNPANDGELARLISSNPATPVDENGSPNAIEDDRTDHGVDPATDGLQTTNGIVSPLITLSATTPPTGDEPEAADGEIVADTPNGNHGRSVTDDYSDLTVDFGFYEETNLFSIGNRVWEDTNNNGTVDGTEAGIEDVELRLYLDANADGVPDTPGDPFDDPLNPGTDYVVTTNAGGYYLFDNLPNNRYIVQVSERNFNGTAGIADLRPFVSSTGSDGDNEEDTGQGTPPDENGRDPVDGDTNGDGVANGTPNNSVRDEYQVRGVYSPSILLEPENEPINEPNPDPTAADPSGNAEDDNSDLTVDFGFYQPMSLGNRVWLDNGIQADGTINPAQLNDGIINGAEVGIAGVRVELFFDTDSSGGYTAGDVAVDDPNQAGTQPYVTTTRADDGATAGVDESGYYIFDNLLPGDYIVRIPFGTAGVNFNGGPLANHENSVQPNPVDGTADNNDHGIFPNDTPVTAEPGVVSPVIVLSYGNEPDGADDDEAVTGTGPLGASDNNSDLTVDFGFYVPPMSLGNRVFFDLNNDGIFDADGLDNIAGNADDELGIANVELRLWTDTNNDGVPDAAVDNPFIAGTQQYVVTTTADNGGTPENELGAYLFDGLAPGRYIVQMSERNFDSVVATANGLTDLSEFRSSTGNGGDNQEDTDVDENGRDPVDGDTNGDGVADGTPNNGVIDEYQARGVYSTTIELSLTNEPLSTGATPDEIDPGANPASGSARDNNSDITVDFGLYRPMSIGNIVWSDDGRTSATTDDVTLRNNGVRDTEDANGNGTLDGGEDTNGNGVLDSELGIAGVEVQLFFDTNGNGRFDAADTAVDDPNQAGTQPYVTTTRTDDGGTAVDETGYYLFDGLLPGNYLVVIAASEFGGGQPLNGYISSVDGNNANPQGDARPDDNDHGVDRVDGDTTGDGVVDGTPNGNLRDEYLVLGVTSPVIPLVYDGEPTTGDNELVTGTGRNSEADDNSDLTVDFGFVPPPMSIGNRVWFDANNSGTIDAGDDFDTGTAGDQPGIPGVVVRLLDAGTGNPIQRGGVDYTFTTDAQGYYLFDNLRPGDYIVEIVPGAANQNFQTGGALVGLVNSSVQGTDNTSDTNADENGQNPIDGDTNGDGTVDGTPNNSVVDEYQARGLRSTTITLAAGTEPVAPANEVDIPPNNPANVTAFGPERIGRTGELDADSNITVDFGFYRPLSIGNRVWLDNGRTGATTFDTALQNDGILNGAEEGIAGVEVALFFDDGTGNPGTAVPDPTNPANPYTDTTDATGYYLFDGLVPGDYIVVIAGGGTGVNFNGGPLDDLVSSADGGTAPTDATADNNDHGIDRTDGNSNGTLLDEYIANGVISPVITLSVGNEPDPTNTPDDDEAVTGTGRFGELDNNSDLTVDFGFVQPPMSLGNRVWFDANNSSTIDAGDDFDTGTGGDQPGIPGVVLRLLDAGTGNPVQRGGADYTVTTDAAGYYLFDNLRPGSYIVEIIPGAANQNFQTGGALAGLLNSYGQEVDTADDTDANGNGGENGQNPTDGNGNGSVLDEMQANGIRSGTIVLALGTESTAETDIPADNAANRTAYGPDRIGRFGELNADSNITVDFGFYRPLSIGNRVWLDNNNNAEIDAGEPGINGVIVELYVDTDGNGSFSAGDQPMRDPNNLAVNYTSTTQSDGADAGYYIFDGLAEGTYVVRIAPRNFDADGPDNIAGNADDGVLVTAAGAPYFSSETDTPPQSNYLDTSDNVDSQDHGNDENNPATTGVSSNAVQLSYGNETDGAADADLDTDGGAGTSGEGRNGELDNNAEMAIDFGFYTAQMSLGNFVFIDYDNNRRFNPTPLTPGLPADVGIDGVRLQLFTDPDGNGVPNTPVDDPNQPGTQDYIATTNANGYYIFDRLTPGQYVVQVLPSNFQAGGPLLNYFSSQDIDRSGANPVIVTPTDDGGTDPNDDLIENGIDRNRTSLITNPDLSVTGLFSPSVNLTPGAEEEFEGAVGGTPAESVEGLQPGVGNGEPNVQDTNSDLTVDFGFYQPMSIGNLVFIDLNDNDVFDPATESGVGGVRVNLYRNDDGNATFDPGAGDNLVPMFFDDGTGTPVMRTYDITNPDGFYLFDNLPPGQYWVEIDADNFAADDGDPNDGIPGAGALVGYGPVAQNTGDGVDNNSNGAETGANVSNLTVLGNPSGTPATAYGTEVVTETVESGVPSSNPAFYDGPQSYGRFGERDNNSDISVDFGYRLAPTNSMSIGNRVWIDEDGANALAATDRNGNIDAADVGATGNLGVNGVTLFLYMDTNGDGIPDSTTPVAKDITANSTNGDGYYLFDVRDNNAATAPAFTGTNLADADGDEAGGALMPGRYVIAIPNTMFAAGGPLEGYRSTLTNNPNSDDQTDNDDNGNDALNATYGLLSQSFQLTQNGEASATNPPDDTDVSGADGVGEGNGQFNGNNITDENSELTLDFGFYQPMSIGNRVWVDNNNNGQFDAGDTAPPGGVTVTLYRETAGSDNANAFDGAGSTNADEPVRIDTATGQIQTAGTPAGGTVQNYTVTTDNNGYYIFDNLPPGDYYVVVDNTNFDNSGDTLFGYQGSNGDTPGNTEDTGDATDGNDNGLDAPNPVTVGIPSSLIPLRFGTEPTGETGSGNTTAHGPQSRGRFGETDTNSNLTIDFAVFPSTRYAIGNRVWVDEGTVNGTQDVGENGVGNANPNQGVLMRLYRFTDDATPGLNDPANELTPVNDPANPSQRYEVTTDASGYYLFQALPAGQYVVSVAPQNFQNISIGGAPAALIGFGPTTQVPNAANVDHDTDLLSDHVNATLDNTFGYYSNVYTLGNGTGSDEPTKGTGGNQERLPDGSPETFTDGTDTSGTAIPDNRSNLTVDFGFVRTLSVGNRVWYDANADGTNDIGEDGIFGVQLQLFTDRDGDGTVEPDTDDSAVVATTTTDNDGFYMFNNLPPGDYIIRIPAAAPNFDGGTGALDSYSGSTTTVTTPDTGDLNDNGIDPGTYGTDPIDSEQFTLVFNGAPLNENQLGNNTAIYGPQNRGLNGEADNNSDMTRDFGFISTPYSLGNRVWIDNGAGGGTANDSNYTAGEPTVPNVTVNLFNDFDPATGIPNNPNTPFRTVQTDANGYYRFDNIPPDDYVVQIDESEFAAGGDLAGFSSSPGTPSGDNQDSGRDDTNLTTLGVLSGIVDLNPPPALPTNEQSSDATGADPTGTDPSGNAIPDANSDLTVDFGFVEAFDWGDAPDTYGTNNNTGDSGDPANDDADEVGPNHRIVAGLFMGADVDDESDGAPVAPGADNNPGNGDGANNRDDEEGFDPTVRLVAGTAVRIEVNVTNNTGGPANLIAWFDWNRNGVFDDSEATPVLSVPTGTNGVVTLPEIDIPASANNTGGALNTYARFRLTNDPIASNEPTGPKASGEVEDYQVAVQPPGLSISKSDGRNSVVAGQTTTYTIIVQNSGLNERNDVRFVDDIPVATTGNRDGLVGGTITWTCTATNGASCENRADPVNDPPVTTRTGAVAAEAGAGNFEIDERIDLPPGGRIVYEVTGQLDSQAGQTGGTNFVNRAVLPQEVPPIEDTDDNGIIFDPPSGVKSGALVGGNVLRWTMIWYNTGTTQAGVTISDTLGANQTLPASNADVDLQCTTNTAGGTTGGCTISADRQTITWTGTMANSSAAAPADAVTISFNVLIPGNGTYNNSGTLTGFPAPNAVLTAAAAVTVGDDGDSSSDDDGAAGPQLEDPAIVKLVDPAFALPGEEVTWTVIVTNPNNASLFDVSFSDNVPFQMEILGVEADTGDVVISGNNVTWTAAIMPAGQSVSVRIQTRLRSDVDSDTSVIINTAVLNLGPSAQAELLTAFELPETGERPWWALPLWLLLITGFGGAVALMIAAAYVRYKRE